MRNLALRRGSLPSLFNDDVFGEFFKEFSVKSKDGFVPALNVKENDSEYIIEAELPGVSKDQIDISIKDNSLCIKGEKKTFNEEKKENYHHVERSYGSFYRTVPLASDVDAEKISASFENGLLSVHVGKAQPIDRTHRKIDIR